MFQGIRDTYVQEGTSGNHSGFHEYHGFFLTMPSSSSRHSPTLQVTLIALVPLIAIYYTTALLVTLKNTVALRLALLPITLFLIWRAATTVAVEDPRLNHLNFGFLMVLVLMSMRSVEWTLRLKPYCRQKHPKYVTKPSYQIFYDAIDLVFNVRGVGWCWGSSCPSHIFPPITSSFMLDTCIRASTYLVVFDIFTAIIQTYGSLSYPHSNSIFDPTLPLYLRYAKSTTLTFFTGMSVYTALSALYAMCSLFGMLVLQHDRDDWPSLFNSPFSSGSLVDFWGRRWHQLFRRNFVVIGGKPFHFLFGKPGGVVGVFLVSGLLHDWGMWGMGQGTEFVTVGGYFLIQSLGIIVEGALETFFNIAVQGMWGRIWTIIWVIFPANLMVDAWFRRGLIECIFIPAQLRPSAWLLSLLS